MSNSNNNSENSNKNNNYNIKTTTATRQMCLHEVERILARLDGISDSGTHRFICIE